MFLGDFDFDCLLLGDGESILGAGKKTFEDFLTSSFYRKTDLTIQDL